MPAIKHSDLKHILYIDDDHDILALARLALEKIGGFSVDTCSNSSECIALAKVSRPDLIMLDVMMPDIDGPSLLRILKENMRLRDTPVVFVTARVQPAELDKYASLGALGIIPKPFNPMTLPEDILALWSVHHKNTGKDIVGNMEKLRQKYLKNLSAKRVEVEAFWSEARVNKLSPARLKKIEMIVHNLAGSGEIYGYSTISKSARLLEDMLAQNPRSAAVSAGAAKLLAAIDKALIGRD